MTTPTLPNNVYDLPREPTPLPALSRTPTTTPATQASAFLEKMAAELDDNVGHRPRDLGDDANMEEALLKFNRTMKDNTALRTRLAEAEGKVLAAQADAESLRRRADELQSQRDAYANYSIEMKTRMETLLVMLDGNAAEVEAAVAATMTSIEAYVDNQVNQLRIMFAGNAQTSAKLITEALDAAKKEAVARIQEKRDSPAA